MQSTTIGQFGLHWQDPVRADYYRCYDIKIGKPDLIPETAVGNYALKGFLNFHYDNKRGGVVIFTIHMDIWYVQVDYHYATRVDCYYDPEDGQLKEMSSGKVVPITNSEWLKGTIAELISQWAQQKLSD
jgi:hypothetical protein